MGTSFVNYTPQLHVFFGFSLHALIIRNALGQPAPILHDAVAFLVVIDDGE
jgi:hypothetical protein